MESRTRILFLIMPMFALSGCAATKNLFGFGREETPPPAQIIDGQVVEPEVATREIKEPKIDSEDFELGAFIGVLSIEDFGSSAVYGARLAYHVTEGFLRRGQCRPVGGRPDEFRDPEWRRAALSDDERTLTYYNLNVGYNILPGEAFHRRRPGVTTLRSM